MIRKTTFTGVIIAALCLLNYSTSSFSFFQDEKGMSVDAFNQKVSNKSKIVFVYFHADWCAPCKTLGPIFDQVEAEEQQKFELLRVDVDKNTTLGNHFEINTLPAYTIYKGGKSVWTSTGALTKQEIVNKINFYSK
jgi:thioredoxin 1